MRKMNNFRLSPLKCILNIVDDLVTLELNKQNEDARITCYSCLDSEYRILASGLGLTKELEISFLNKNLEYITSLCGTDFTINTEFDDSGTLLLSMNIGEVRTQLNMLYSEISKKYSYIIANHIVTFGVNGRVVKSEDPFELSKYSKVNVYCPLSEFLNHNYLKTDENGNTFMSKKHTIVNKRAYEPITIQIVYVVDYDQKFDMGCYFYYNGRYVKRGSYEESWGFRNLLAAYSQYIRCCVIINDAAAEMFNVYTNSAYNEFKTLERVTRNLPCAYNDYKSIFDYHCDLLLKLTEDIKKKIMNTPNGQSEVLDGLKNVSFKKIEEYFVRAMREFGLDEQSINNITESVKHMTIDNECEKNVANFKKLSKHLAKSQRIMKMVKDGTIDDMIKEYNKSFEKEKDNAMNAIIEACGRHGEKMNVGYVRAESKDENIYDLEGKKVSTSLEGQPKGIYIRDGKEFVIN